MHARNTSGDGLVQHYTKNPDCYDKAWAVGLYCSSMTYLSNGKTRLAAQIKIKKKKRKEERKKTTTIASEYHPRSISNLVSTTPIAIFLQLGRWSLPA
jgi:hypothetical protein